MKVGDLVELDFHVTRKGRPEDDQVGLVIEIKEIDTGRENRVRTIAIVNFCGTISEYPVGYLRIVNEDR